MSDLDIWQIDEIASAVAVPVRWSGVMLEKAGGYRGTSSATWHQGIGPGFMSDGYMYMIRRE